MAYILATTQDDTVFATHSDDVIGGKEGNDTIYARDGDDDVWDTIGNNWISGGDGDDYLVTGSGNDTVYGNNDNDTIYSGGGDDHVHGGNGDDWIRDVSGYNDISGGQGADVIEFSASSHRIYGGDYGQGADGATDTFKLVSWHENVDLTNTGQVGDVIGYFEVGVDILNLAELGIQASHVTIGTYANGYMVSVDNGTNSLDIGVRTGTSGALTMSDIVVAV